MTRPPHTHAGLALIVLTLCASTTAYAWPNGPDDNPLDDPPNDPNYLRYDGDGRVVDGAWNLWSFTPELWSDNPGFREEEIALGVGMSADRGWQITTGDPRVIIAVLDSGAYWDSPDLINKYYLNRDELNDPAQRPFTPDGFDGDPFDVNADGVFNIRDYLHFDREGQLARLDAPPGNNNGVLDPQDLIGHFSDGQDDDNNGYTDDISGWDFFWGDNDAYDNSRFGHGNGEAKDSTAEGNNGIQEIGVCPDCTALMVRVGDSFVTDSNDFGAGVAFAVDSGASVIQEALGTVNNTRLSRQAIEYAYQNNVVVIASAADELSFHHNMPGTNNHTVYVHAIVHDAPRDTATTFLNFNNCTNYGGQLLLSTPGGACSSEATGKTSGHAGLLYAAALERDLTPPLTAEEVRALMIMSVDDVSVPESLDRDREGTPCTSANVEEVCGPSYICHAPLVDPAGTGPYCLNTKYPSTDGWDFHFGYGRNNVRASLDLLVEDRIPPETDIESPLWFQTFDPTRTPTVEITGRIGDRVDQQPNRYASYTYTVEYAIGADPKDGWVEITSGTTPGISGTLATLDLSTLPDSWDISNSPTDPHEDALTLRVRASAQSATGEVRGEFRKTIFIHHDPTLLHNFPIQLEGSADGSPKLADLDGNGTDEIILASSAGLLHAIRFDGTQLDGFPVPLGLRPSADPNLPGNHLSSCAFQDDKTNCAAKNYTINKDIHQPALAVPAVGDLDRDGDLEVVVSTWDGSVFVIQNNGQIADNFPVTSDWNLSEEARILDIERTRRFNLDHGFFSSPVLYDLDGDEDLEIIQAGQDQHIYVWHHDGQPMSGFPVLCRDREARDEERGYRIVSTPAVGDLDGDGSPEILTGTNEHYETQTRFYIISAQGNDDPNGPFRTGGPVQSSNFIGEILPLVGQGIPGNPVIADVDQDGRLEFMIEGLGTTPQVMRLENDEVVRVATVDTARFGPDSNATDGPVFPFINHGSVGRLDPSGKMAYIKGTVGFGVLQNAQNTGVRAPFNHHISAWRIDPTNVQGNLPPIDGFPQVVEDWQFFMNPAIADLDNIGGSEVIFGTGGYLVRALDYRGNEVDDFPKFTGGWITASPAVGDLDGDGRLEVVTSTRNGWLYAWTTRGASSRQIDWPMFAHDLRNTNNASTPQQEYPPVCGNNVREHNEECDGSDMPFIEPPDGCWTDGPILCTEDCKLDVPELICDGGDVGVDAGADVGDDAGSNDAGGDDVGTNTSTSTPPTSPSSDDGSCCTVPRSDPRRVPLSLLILLCGGVVCVWMRRGHKE